MTKNGSSALRFFPVATQPALCVALGLATLATGCTTKKYVRNQTAPVIQKTNELDDATAANNRAVSDLDRRTSAGIGNAQTSADNATSAANTANTNAQQAQQSAQDAVHRADSLSSVVANLDNYQKVSDVSVHFAFNQAVLTRQAKADLDGMAAQLGAQKGYLLQLTGGTDSVGSADYNYQLSERRAQAVVQYLASKYNVPPHRFYLIGLGKDQAAASNASAKGRAQNRRVEVQLLSNQTGAPPQSPATAASSTGLTGSRQ
jgi:OmpA-OmpF porin, OOP family